CHVLGALAEAHRLGIVHRDVKPSNVLFDEAGATRLADFGAAHVSDVSATATAGVIGTLAYMSPEQRYGQPATPLSDVYSVGATLLEMLTGQPPPPASGTPHKPSSFHPDLGPSHDDAILTMLAEHPGARPQGALAARTRLQALLWPNTIRGEWALAPGEPRSSAQAEQRLARGTGGTAEDRWLGRRLRVVPDDPRTRLAARAYAALGSPVLATVLRVDSEAAEIWFEEPQGDRLSDTAKLLSAQQARLLGEALAALHARGVTHGAVDAAHVVVLRDGLPVLLFEPQAVGAEGDLEALQRLTGST
ncbi:MAG: protein kinase, partial [Polyangiaceae bacterium]|nr:protein kinase [Polyangiaceae bacterium]